MPVPQPRMATWQIVLVLAVAVLGLITTYEVSYATTPTPTTTPAPSFCPGAISWAEASQYVGSEKRVKGPVVSTSYASRSKGQPTFLNLGQPYPNQKFTVVIWGRNRANFPGAPDQTYRAQTICVTGLIETYQGKPQIEATAARQIVVLTSPTPTPIPPTPIPPTPIPPTPRPPVGGKTISPITPPIAAPSPSPIVPVGSIIAVTVLGIGVYQFVRKRIRTKDDD